MSNLLEKLFGPPLAECARCHRKTWSPEDVGASDHTILPAGVPCRGTFIPLENP